MEYFAASYYLAKSHPLGKEGHSILLLSKSLDEGLIGPTIRDGGDLPIRNILINENLIAREDFMSPEPTGIYESKGDNLEEVAQNIAEKYNGTIVKNEGIYLALNLNSKDSEKFHIDHLNLNSILRQPDMRRE